MYDSTQDTKDHIYRVRDLLSDVVDNLNRRRLAHDKSKLEEPEKGYFDRLTPKLKELSYGNAEGKMSDEYKAALAELAPALSHHYAHNPHHPEFFENGINGMSLLDLVEALVDWMAAGERHKDGNIRKSITVNKERFGMSDQLEQIFINTVEELGW